MICVLNWPIWLNNLFVITYCSSITEFVITKLTAFGLGSRIRTYGRGIAGNVKFILGILFYVKLLHCIRNNSIPYITDIYNEPLKLTSVDLSDSGTIFWRHLYNSSCYSRLKVLILPEEILQIYFPKIFKNIFMFYMNFFYSA